MLEEAVSSEPVSGSPKFPASRENTGNFIGWGLGDGSTGNKNTIESASYEPIPYDRSSAENPVQERILGAAFKAFTQDGYAGTSTLDIATRAKISKRDLYANSSTAICVCCHLFVAGAALQRVAAQHGARG